MQSTIHCRTCAPLQTPLHLDIPYVAASPQSHSNTLAAIECFDTPRASNYGPVSEAGKARVAARKHSMRQEHLAAIANLNTFARKRSSKSPYSASGTASGKRVYRTWTLSSISRCCLQLSDGCKASVIMNNSAGVADVAFAGSDSGSCQSASRHSTPTAASVGSEHNQQPPGSRQRPPSVVVYHSPHMHGEPGWSDEPVLVDAIPVSHPSSGSAYGASDWCQDDSGQDQSSCQMPAVDPVSTGGPANLEMPGQPNISTTADALQGQPLIHAANLSSVPLLAQDSSLNASTSSPCADSAHFHSSKAPKAAATSRSCDSLTSSQQDASSPMHSNTSASSFYTKAGSVSSKACSSPVRHNLAVSKPHMLGSGGPAHSAPEPDPTTASQLLHQPSSQVKPLRQPSAAGYKVRHSHSNDCKFAPSRNDHAMLAADSQHCY